MVDSMNKKKDCLARNAIVNSFALSTVCAEYLVCSIELWWSTAFISNCKPQYFNFQAMAKVYMDI